MQKYEVVRVQSIGAAASGEASARTGGFDESSMSRFARCSGGRTGIRDAGDGSDRGAGAGRREEREGGGGEEVDGGSYTVGRPGFARYTGEQQRNPAAAAEGTRAQA